MPSAMRYPVEPFVPQTNVSGTPASQQQEELPAREGSVTPTPRRLEQALTQNGSGTASPQPSVIMPVTNGSGMSFPILLERSGSESPSPQQQEETQTRNGSMTPVPRQEELQTPRNVPGTSAPQPQQVPMQNGDGFPSANASREPPRHSPFFMNIGSETYIRFDEAARFFGQQNVNSAPHPPQPNGHDGNWAPHVSAHNGPFLPQVNERSAPFPPQPNGHGDHGFITESPVFRPQTAPPPHMLPPQALPGRDRSNTIRSLEFTFQGPPPPYHGPETPQYGLNYQYPADQYYYPMFQPQYPVFESKTTAPSVKWFAPVHLRKMAPVKSDDPEAKLFVGDLPVIMTTEALGDALRKRFGPFGECKVNVTWRVKRGPDGAERSLPTGWIQYKTLFEAAKALDVAKERGFAIGKRPVRIDRADGKRICRMWPSNPHTTLSLDDFKNAVRQYAHHIGLESAYCMLYHASSEIEMVDKNYGGKISTVPSVGLVFRWVEDASYSEQKFSEFTHRFRLKIEHVNCGIPGWREGPVSLRVMDALLLDTGEKWQEELTLSRRRLRDKGEEFPDGKLAKYPDRISKKLVPRSILEHPRLKKDVFGFDPLDSLDWLDVHREPPTFLARASSTREMSQVNGQTNGHSNYNANHQTNGEASHQTNDEDNHKMNGQASHQTSDEAGHRTNGETAHSTIDA